MTVEELINQLEKFNKKTEVLVFVESENNYMYGNIENLTYIPDDEEEMVSDFVTINCVEED